MQSTASKHIDDVQPQTIDEHFEALVNDEETINYDPSEDVTPTDLPEWYDQELFRAGQQYHASNQLAILISSLNGLIAVLAIPSILKILIYTKQSGTPCTAFRRYLETILYVRAWYTKNPNDNKSDWYQSMNTVRYKHINSNRRSLHAGIGGITHRDLAFTQFGFIGYVLIYPELLGLTNTPKQREGFNHLWRVVGHMLGIPDRLNICRKTEAETTQLCKQLKDKVFGKYFKEIPQNFPEMTYAMLDGMWAVDMMINADATFAFAYKLNDVPYPKALGLVSKLSSIYRRTVLKLCVTPYVGVIVRNYFNYLMPVSLWIAEHFPIVAWIQWGIKESKIRLYPKLR